MQKWSLFELGKVSIVYFAKLERRLENIQNLGKSKTWEAHLFDTADHMYTLEVLSDNSYCNFC